MASAPLTCPKCARPIPASAPRELCPACLVTSAFDLLEEGPMADTPELPSPAALSDRLGGYELLEQIGRGGMGVVFRARDPRLNRMVALKLLLTGKLASDVEVKRFRTEAEAAARLAHPNIVPIYEVGEDKGVPFFTVKLVEGGTLAGRMEVHGPIEANQTALASMMVKVARAVHFAHQHGILHRDLKPANILLDRGDEPLVTDFGLARRLESGSGITVSGDLLGTPSYMAPEVAASGSRQATTASDIYSLGAILYQMLTGRPPFEATTVAALLRKITEEEPVSPSRVRPKTGRVQSRPRAAGRLTGTASEKISGSAGEPPRPVDRDLETICLKCLAKDPSARYPSAQALAEELERWLRGEPILARPTARWEQAIKWSKRKPAWALLSGMMLLAPVVIISLLVAGNARVRRAQSLTRLNLYAADMQVVQTALEDANLGLARLILDSYRPRPGEPDLRGFEWRYLSHLARSGQLRVLRAHSQPVNSLTFSRDGNWLASTEAGRTAWFWSTSTWKPERVIDWSGPQRSQFRSLSFSPDGSAIAVTQDDGYVPVFDAGSLRANYFLSPGWPAGGLAPRAFWSPATPKLAFLAADPQGHRFTAVLDWRAFQANPGRSVAGTNAIVQEYKPPGQYMFYPEAPILRLPPMDVLHGFTSDGRLLAGREGKLFLLDVEHGTDVLPVPSAHRFDFCEISHDGRFLAGFNSEPKDRHSILMDEFQAGLTNYWEMIGHEGDIRCLAISPDSQQLLSGSADHTARIWDRATRKTVALLRGHIDEVTAVAWSPDGKFIATGSKDRTVMLWTGQTTNRFETGQDPLTAAFPPWVISEDSATLAAVAHPDAASGEERIAVWNVARREVTRLPFVAGMLPLALSTNGQELVTINPLPAGNAELRTWTLAKRAASAVQALSLPGAKESSGAIWALSPDRRWLTRNDQSGRLAAWRLDTKTGAVRPSRAALSPDFEETAGQTTHPNGTATQAVFSRDGKKLAVLNTPATGHSSTTVFLLGERIELKGSFGYGAKVNSLAWSPDTTLLAAACEDHTVQFWSIETRRLVRTLAGHKRGVTAVAFSPDGRTLASGDGRTIELWHVPTGRQMLTVSREIKLGDPLRLLTFTHDSTRLVAADEGGRVQFFLGPSFSETNTRQ